jgi:uncharacterized membrane protein (UPF0127 family)
MKRTLLVLLLAACAIASAQRVFPLNKLQKVTLKVRGHAIRAWVMDDEAKGSEGMMWLKAKDVPKNAGMIFVFPAAQPVSFWMKNTLIPLDIIFISAKKRVVNVAAGKPQDLTPLPSRGPVKYVLEMRQGAAKRLGIKSGTAIAIPSTVIAK